MESRAEARAQEHARFRKDVEGLRAVAVLLVMLYHAGLALPRGGFIGVDVFFVVSGFVITAGLLRELDSTGRISLMTFYGRRAKRLLPAAGVVLVVTALMSWWMVSRVQWRTIGGDILGSGAYVVNWVFSARSVDYLAEDVEPSPVLHFWSLAVEEQFYLIWPVLLIFLSVLTAQWTWRGSTRATLALGTFAVLVLPSFLFALWMSSARPQEAFFITPTRLWELGIGALVAIGAATWRRLPVRPAVWLAWIGLAAILVSAVVADSGSTWPAPGALLPTLGTAAVIIAGFSARRQGVPVLLGMPIMVQIGALSYSLYLWHWPLLRFATWQWGELAAWQGLLVVVFSALPAWLSYRWVEQPIRKSRRIAASPRLALTVGMNFTVVSIVAGLVLTMGARPAAQAGDPETLLDPGELGAGQLIDPTGAPPTSRPTTDPDATTDPTSAPDPTSDPEATAEPTQGPQPTDQEPPEPSGPVPPTLQDASSDPFFDTITPDPLVAVDDLPSTYGQDCQTNVQQAEVRRCDGGDPDGSVTVALVGDSKIAQWVPAFEAMAEDNGWVLHSYVKSGCPYADATVEIENDAYESCDQWNVDLRERLTGTDRPDVLVVSGVRGQAMDGDGGSSRQALIEGYRRAWQELIEEGTLVLALSDSPRPEYSAPVYECVAEHGNGSECTWDYEQSSGSQALEGAAADLPGAHYIDMDPWICPEGTCLGVYRSVLTYRQGSHLTATFTLVLAPPLAQFVVPMVTEHVS